MPRNIHEPCRDEQERLRKRIKELETELEIVRNTAKKIATTSDIIARLYKELRESINESSIDQVG